jgi:hypothetical protein
MAAFAKNAVGAAVCGHLGPPIFGQADPPKMWYLNGWRTSVSEECRSAI